MQELINKKHSAYINSENYQENPKKFWKLANIRNNKTSSFPDKMQDGESDVTTPMDKVNAFNKFFFSSFNQGDYILPHTVQFQNNNLSYLQLTVNDVHFI